MTKINRYEPFEKRSHWTSHSNNLSYHHTTSSQGPNDSGTLRFSKTKKSSTLRAVSLPLFTSLPSSEKQLDQIKHDIFHDFRHRLSEAIDNGNAIVDLSDMSLPYLPTDIEEIKCMTSINCANQIVSPQIELYLHGNCLTSLPLGLFSIKNLIVLSLRKNQLTGIPPIISHLERLKELSIANNNIKCLPIELQGLSLKVFLVHPNPFYTQLEIMALNNVSSSQKAKLGTLSLQEITSRHILKTYLNSITTSHEKQCDRAPIFKLPYCYQKIMPASLYVKLGYSLQNHACSICKMPFVDYCLVFYQMDRILEETQIPFSYRICSVNCYKRYLLMLSVNNIIM